MMTIILVRRTFMSSEKQPFKQLLSRFNYRELFGKKFDIRILLVT